MLSQVAKIISHSLACSSPAEVACTFPAPKVSTTAFLSERNSPPGSEHLSAAYRAHISAPCMARIHGGGTPNAAARILPSAS